MTCAIVTGIAQETSFEIESRLHIHFSKSTRLPEVNKLSATAALADSLLPTGGAEGIRTLDIQLAKLALSQLSYSPSLTFCGPRWSRTTDLTLIRRALSPTEL